MPIECSHCQCSDNTHCRCSFSNANKHGAFIEQSEKEKAEIIKKLDQVLRRIGSESATVLPQS